MPSPKTFESVPASNYTSRGTLLHRTQTHYKPSPSSWTTTSLERVRIIKVAVKLWHSWPVQTQIARSRNGFGGSRDFPHVIVYFVNEWVAHNATADKLERHTDKSFGWNKNVSGSHQQMVTTSASGGRGGTGDVTHEIVFEKEWNPARKDWERAWRGREKKHKHVDWLRAGCLMSRPVVIGWEVWPHLKTGLLQFIDSKPRKGVSTCWCGHNVIFTAPACRSEQPQMFERVKASVCACLDHQFSPLHSYVSWKSNVSKQFAIKYSHLTFFKVQLQTSCCCNRTA